ncbi:MAG: signal peptidase I [Bacilli bacterium]|nr:signal peptidase I [Bacilli bacterium]MDD4407505.1 signal peptidase I [Bacilli bacterium]
MKKLKELINIKGLKVLINIIYFIFIVFILSFIITVYLQRFSENKMSFFNYRIFTVVTASMEPKYKIGDVLLSKEVEPSTIKPGDDISYFGSSGDIKGKIVTHQVISVETNSRGEYLFRAKGLGNIIEDPTIYESQLLGVVTYKINSLSFLYKIIATDIGFYLCIIVPLVGIIGYEIAITMFNIEDKKRSKKLNENN